LKGSSLARSRHMSSGPWRPVPIVKKKDSPPAALNHTPTAEAGATSQRAGPLRPAHAAALSPGETPLELSRRAARGNAQLRQTRALG
jgi:hypothetical protein